MGGSPQRVGGCPDSPWPAAVLPVPGPSPWRRRRLLLATCLAALLLTGVAAAQVPTAGRYRCYEPPRYAVIAWFDLDAGRIAVNGAEPMPYRSDPARARIELPAAALPPWRHGWFFAPGAPGGDAQRVTLVLAANEVQRPGAAGWDRLPRCYLTTH